MKGGSGPSRPLPMTSALKWNQYYSENFFIPNTLEHLDMHLPVKDPQGGSHLLMCLTVQMWLGGESWAYRRTSHGEKQETMYEGRTLTIRPGRVVGISLLCQSANGGRRRGQEKEIKHHLVSSPLSGPVHGFVWQPTLPLPTVRSSGNAWEVF